MKRLINKRILLGVCGSIAAYKSADLVRRLREHGAEVQVVMTQAATKFITPLTMQALSGRPVRDSLLDTAAEAAMGHIELARWADVVLVAPVSADFLSRLAGGRADDLLSALCLACEEPIVVAPAMNQAMWKNVATQENAGLLKQRGIQVLGPASGEQACGEEGQGRMLEPEDILHDLANIFETNILTGARVLVSAGPTREPIDPVRFISNRSSGKMGYRVAEAARDAGARVILISGPVNLKRPEGMDIIEIESAEQLL
ncbi:MAG: bifunctional phosphopantothenoylcysteine decarboxylase/phosphopantothenate--cysteine ligase CoaBC, partial [Gammaproteobacteria bacterium]|nr:bifunctional phosphopantothenoylcysteine decarboxylase/phosphopantothenate--cysteine ligase CoaBC [Gammaproteobacteria bacterium]